MSWDAVKKGVYDRKDLQLHDKDRLLHDAAKKGVYDRKEA